MENILFENKFKRGREAMKEIYYRYFMCGPVTIAIYIVLALYLVSFIIAAFVSVEAVKQAAVPLAMLIFAALLMQFRYRQSVKLAVERDNEISGGEGLDVNITVTEDGFTNISEEGQSTIGFDRVKSAFVTKNYIAVLTKAKLIYILKKDSFTVGDFDGFVAFLQAKGIKVKGKKK